MSIIITHRLHHQFYPRPFFRTDTTTRNKTRASRIPFAVMSSPYHFWIRKLLRILRLDHSYALVCECISIV